MWTSALYVTPSVVDLLDLGPLFSDETACSLAHISKLMVDLMRKTMSAAEHRLFVEYAKTVVAHSVEAT